MLTHVAEETNFTRTSDHFLNTLHATNNYALTAWGPRWGALMDFASGGINYHIEHHLFPSVQYYDLHKVAPVVRAFCREKSLPYNEYHYPDLVRAHFKTVLKPAKGA